MCQVPFLRRNKQTCRFSAILDLAIAVFTSFKNDVLSLL